MKMKHETMTDTTPLDEIISRVESYIKNPKLVTEETLTEVRDDLVDLKKIIDGEDTDEMNDTNDTNMEDMKGMEGMEGYGKKMKEGKHGLTVIIGSLRGGK